MKIALVSPYDFAYPGGVNSHVSQLAARFAELGHQVKIIAPSSRPIVNEGNPELIAVGRPVSVPASGSVARISLSLRLGGTVRRILDREGFDIVHVHEPLVPMLPIMFLRFSQAINIGTFHAYHRRSRAYFWGRRLLKRWFHKLDGKIAVSRPAADFISRYFPGYYNVIPNGVDVATFATPLPPLERFVDGKVNILFVGRWEKRKGLDYLLRAFAHVKRDYPNTRLMVVGPEGRGGEAYRWYVERLGIEDVVFAGFVPTAELPRYHQAAHVFCAPATGEESFGIVLLEAMAARLPIVASAIPGYASVASDGEEAILVPPKDEDALANALRRVIADPELRQRMADKGWEKVQAYDWSCVAARVLAYYERLRSQQPSARGGLEREPVA